MHQHGLLGPKSTARTARQNFRGHSGKPYQLIPSLYFQQLHGFSLEAVCLGIAVLDGPLSKDVAVTDEQSRRETALLTFFGEHHKTGGTHFSNSS